MDKKDAFEKFFYGEIRIGGENVPRWQTWGLLEKNSVKEAFYRAWELALASIAEPAKPCPFCGSTDGDTDTNGTRMWVQCNSCFCEGPKATTDDEAIKAWNKRI